MRFLVDENLPTDVAELLRSRGHDVLYLPQSSYRGSTDRKVWQLAVGEQRVIVTRDLDFPLAELPQPPGLVLVRVPHGFTRGRIAEVLAEFVASPNFERIAGAITVVSPGRIRVRKLS